MFTHFDEIGSTHRNILSCLYFCVILAWLNIADLFGHTEMFKVLQLSIGSIGIEMDIQAFALWIANEKKFKFSNKRQTVKNHSYDVLQVSQFVHLAFVWLHSVIILWVKVFHWHVWIISQGFYCLGDSFNIPGSHYQSCFR